MTLKAAHFNPEALLSAPRRSPGVPNATGTKALYSVSKYSFEHQHKVAEIRVLDIESGSSTLLVDDSGASEPVWIGDDEVLYLKGSDRGATRLLLASASQPQLLSYEVGIVNGGISNLKIAHLSDDTIALVVSASTTPSGKLANPQAETRPRSSAKIYTRLFVRHWDTWTDKNRNSLWYGVLNKKEGRWSLASPLVNALAGTNLSSPVPPFGGTGDFDISPYGLVFVAKDPMLDEAHYTKTDLYYVALKTFTEPTAPAPQEVKTGTLQGYSGCPTFSHDGKKVAFTRMRSKQYESDKTRLLLIPDVNDLANVQEFYKTEDDEGGWDARPETILWSYDDSELYVTAEDTARNLLWKLPANPRLAVDLPVAVTQDGSVSAMYMLARGSPKLLVSSSSLVDNSLYRIVDPSDQASAAGQVVSSNTKHGKTLGLSHDQVGDFWFKGAGDYKVHALVMKPSNFDENNKYPLALLVHGGPQGAWADGWSTRWNPAIFAEQGYVVVAPNPTGSFGYGMKLQDGITGDWGGKPYNDLVNCFEHIEDNLPYVDTERAVALGASYGGYMINWIQGHPLGRKFKALVCHDGIFSTLNQWNTEELFFPIHDFGGTLVENRAGYEKWDPSRFVDQWATPELIIHGELDYRIPVVEALAAFNVLQSKNIPSRFVMFPDENHWVLKPENSLVWHREVLGWINKWSGMEEQNLEDQAEKLGIV
ncbi:prolyl oligopeptidase [Thozetella sp. PMI_491]|nr:prolyl oligopeptidase [Thozetella sp. PMI_491]